MIYKNLLDGVGNTPLLNLGIVDLKQINLYVKLEGYNPTGSVKDRAAFYILKKILETGEINKDTLVIESSSGNFAIALSAYCKKLGLKFCSVIDNNISPINETIIRSLTDNVIKITEPDKNGGYLLNRIEKINELKSQVKNSYWVNQYGNPYNAEAYYSSLGSELCEEINSIDYAFIGVSSGGTITGVSKKIKEIYSDAKIIAVDTAGSVIFGGSPKKRFIPGIGSAIKPSILKDAQIDEVVVVTEESAIKMCHQFKEKHSLFIGGSSGSVLSGIHTYFKGKKFSAKPNVVTVFADRGERYLDTIYNEIWCQKNFNLTKNDLLK